MKSWRLIPFLCLLLLPFSAAHAQDAPNFPTKPLTIKTAAGMLHYTVEVATTREQQEYGLMFRKALPDMQGMIFIFPEQKPLTFWMKNTYIPLDMLFIDSKGTIQQIAENAKPESTDIIRSLEPAIAVLELMGGTAASHHIAQGDKVIYPLVP